MHWQMNFVEFDFNVRYKKGLLIIQLEAFYRLRSLGETTVPVDADILTYPPHSDVNLLTVTVWTTSKSIKR